MLKLKSYILNKSRTEGSIAEKYLGEECVTFVSKYIDGIETSLNRPLKIQEDKDVAVDTRMTFLKTLVVHSAANVRLHLIVQS